MNSNLEFIVENSKKQNVEKVKGQKNVELWSNGKIKYKSYKPKNHTMTFQVSTFENGVQEFIGKIDKNSGLCDNHGAIFNKNAEQIKRGSIHNGLLDGLGIKQAINPMQIEIGNFIDDRLYGLDCYILWKNGNLAYHGGMDRGLKHSKGRTYFSDGMPEFIGQFQYDLKHGLNCISYYESGNIKNQGEYRDGRFLEGKKVTFDTTNNKKYNFFSENKELQNFKPLTTQYDSGYNNSIKQILNPTPNENQLTLAKKPARPGSAIHFTKLTSFQNESSGANNRPGSAVHNTKLTSFQNENSRANVRPGSAVHITKITSFQNENTKLNTRPISALRANEDLIHFNIAETVNNLDQNSYYTEADVFKGKNQPMHLSNLEANKRPDSFRSMPGNNFKIKNQALKKVDFTQEDDYRKNPTIDRKNSTNDTKEIDFLNDHMVIGLNICDNSIDTDAKIVYDDEKLNSICTLNNQENRPLSFKSNVSKNQIKYKGVFTANMNNDKLKENQEFHQSKNTYSNFDNFSEDRITSNDNRIKSYTNIGVPKYKRYSNTYEFEKPPNYLAPSERAEAKKHNDAPLDPNKLWQFTKNGTKERSKVIKLKKDREASLLEENSILQKNHTVSKMSSTIKNGYEQVNKAYGGENNQNKNQNGWLKNKDYSSGWKKNAGFKPNLFKSESANQVKEKKGVRKENLLNNLNKPPKHNNSTASNIKKKYGYNQYKNQNDSMNKFNKQKSLPISENSYDMPSMQEAYNDNHLQKNDNSMYSNRRINGEYNAEKVVRFTNDVNLKENTGKNSNNKMDFDPYGLHNNNNMPRNTKDPIDNQDFNDFYNAKIYNVAEKQFFNKENNKVKNHNYSNSSSIQNRPYNAIQQKMQVYDRKNGTNMSKVTNATKETYANNNLKNKISDKFHILEDIKDLKKDEIQNNKEIANFLNTNDNRLHPLSKNLEQNQRFNTRKSKKKDLSSDSESEPDKDLLVDFDDPIAVQFHKMSERVRFGNEVRQNTYKPMQKDAKLRTVDINKIYKNK